jgi:MFS family permease
MLATLRQRNFAFLWFGGLISLTGDRAMMTALPFYVYQQTGSTLQAAALYTAYYLPMVLLGSVAGVFVDRWDRRRIMIVTNLLQACVMLLLLLVRSVEWLWLVYLVAFVASSASIFFGPAESAIVPSLVGEEHLVPANALGSLNNYIARLAGPPIGGALLGLFGLSGVVIVDSVSFLIAGIMAAFISVSSRPAEEPVEPVGVSSEVVSSWAKVWQEWREGLLLVRQKRLLVALFVVNGVTSFGGSMIDPLYAPFVASVLHGSPSALGWLSTTGAIGGLLGGFVVGQWGRNVQPRRLIAYGTLAVGLLMVVIYNQTSLPLVMVLTLIMFVPLVASGVGSQTMLQSGVADRYRGRVYGALGTTIALLGLVALWLAGILGEILGIVPMLSVAGGVTFFAGVLALVLLPRGIAHQEAGETNQVSAGTEETPACL